MEKTQRSVDPFLGRIAAAQLPSVIAVYDNRIRKLEEQKIVLLSVGVRLPLPGQKRTSVRDYSAAKQYARAPCRLWSNSIVLERLVW